MPKDNIQRAIGKGSDKDGSTYTEVTYEGYVHGVAIFIESTTDNVQRTVANVRMVFNKYGGSLGTNGSLSHVFDRKGIFNIPLANITDMDSFELEIIDAGAEDIDVDTENGTATVTSAMEDFGSIMKKLEALKIDTENAQLQRIPVTTMALDADSGKKVLKVIDMFEDDDDVQNVYHNMELTEEMMDEM